MEQRKCAAAVECGEMYIILPWQQVETYNIEIIKEIAKKKT